MVATSATRDAANRDEFFAMTADVLGAVVPGAVAEVITGDEEAALSFPGAVGELDPAAAPFVVVDLGGGSTEVVLGDARGAGELLRRHRLRAADRAVPALRSADGRGDRGGAGLVRDALAEALRVVPVEGARPGWVWRAR